VISLAVLGGRASTHRRLWGRGDIEPPGSPVLTVEDWNDPVPALNRLREWAEAYATHAVMWYLDGKRGKRLGSRALRAGAVVLAVVGGVVALLSNGSTIVGPNVGYALFALAAGCWAFDHFFGLSDSWIRDVATAQELQVRLLRFQLAWTAWQVVEAGYGPAAEAPLAPSAEWSSTTTTPVDVRKRPHDVETARALIEDLVVSVARLTRDETARWARESQVTGTSRAAARPPAIAAHRG
jgi:hypothetical protein